MSWQGSINLNTVDSSLRVILDKIFRTEFGKTRFIHMFCYRIIPECTALASLILLLSFCVFWKSTNNYIYNVRFCDFWLTDVPLDWLVEMQSWIPNERFVTEGWIVLLGSSDVNVLGDKRHRRLQQGTAGQKYFCIFSFLSRSPGVQSLSCCMYSKGNHPRLPAVVITVWVRSDWACDTTKFRIFSSIEILTFCSCVMFLFYRCPGVDSLPCKRPREQTIASSRSGSV